MKKRMFATALSLLVFILALGGIMLVRKQAAKKADIRYGADYIDGRDRIWNLRDTNGNILVRIKAAEGFTLGGQEYGSCSIVYEDRILGKVTLYQDTAVKDAIRVLAKGKKYICHDEVSPKGKNYKILTVGEEAYALSVKESNTVVVRLLTGNINKAGMTVQDAGGSLADMID